MRQSAHVTQFHLCRATYGPTMNGPSRQSTYRTPPQRSSFPSARMAHAANSRMVGVYLASGCQGRPTASAASRYGSFIRPNGGAAAPWCQETGHRDEHNPKAGTGGYAHIEGRTP